MTATICAQFRERLVVRLATASDIEEMIPLNRICFPTMIEEDVVWSVAQLLRHQRLFPEGQIIALFDGKIVGGVASLIVEMGVESYRTHTFAGITDGGYFHNHDLQGDTLYGADVYASAASKA